ncbi:uncharacterized protein LOC119683478 [Teleopsis dalmanni]|uniref:uncharacterized protein LOC119683478 n=1 Tax=Teleopsis dalmanni TaxID=139649 RepID=UPI0018CCBB08|nr:uncharacterized protein LOC119683478 [Teleopsis dalmanni]
MANKLLNKAVKSDGEGRKFEALSIYEHLVFKLMQKQTAQGYKSRELMQLTKNYVERIEVVKAFIDKKFAPAKRIRTKLFMDDSVGAGYNDMFQPYLRSKITEVEIDEPEMNESKHYKNLTDIIIMLTDSCPHLKYIRFVTTYDPKPEATQKRALIKVKNSMLKRGIGMGIKCTDENVEAKVILDNGYIIKTGFGIHYHKLAFDENGKVTQPDDRNEQKCNSTAFEVWRAAGF